MSTAALDARLHTLSPAEASDRLGIAVGTLRNMRSRGGGPPYVRVGRRIRYRLVDLDRWLDQRTRMNTSDPGPDAA